MSLVQVSLANAIMAALQSDATLQGLNPGYGGLAKDPSDNTRLAIFIARFADLQAPVYDSLTYRVSQATPQREFESEPAGTLAAPIDNYRVDFEAWSQTIGVNIPTILGVLETHFRNQTIPLTGGAVSGGNANMFRCQWLTSQPDLFDKDLKAFYGLASFQFRIQR